MLSESIALASGDALLVIDVQNDFLISASLRKLAIVAERLADSHEAGMLYRKERVVLLAGSGNHAGF